MSIPFASMPADDRAGPVAVRGVASVPLHLPGRAGACVASEVITFAGLPEGREHFAVRLGPPPGRPAPLVRLHSECVTGDVLGSARCDCGSQLADGLRRIAEQGGYLLYLRQEGRGIGLVAKLAAYALQDQGHDTYAANRLLGHAPDERRYAVAARMLHALGVHRIALLSNNPDKRAQLIEAGIEVVENVPTGVFARPANRRYLEAKVRIGGHRIDLGA